MTKRTDPHWEHAGLAPPRRLGTLLAQARLASGTSLDELASSSAEWTVERLEAVERGGVEFDDGQLAGVATLYGVDVATIVPPRSKLVVDLDEGILRVDGRRSATEVGEGADRHEVLARYLALVYSMRQVQPGTEITLRVDDLDVLGTCLRVGRQTLVADLESLMSNPDDLVGWRLRLLRKKVLVPARGHPRLVLQRGGADPGVGRAGDGVASAGARRRGSDGGLDDDGGGRALDRRRRGAGPQRRRHARPGGRPRRALITVLGRPRRRAIASGPWPRHAPADCSPPCSSRSRSSAWPRPVAAGPTPAPRAVAPRSTCRARSSRSRPGKRSVDIATTDNEFTPVYVVVNAGTKVTWDNEGRNAHNVVPVDKGSFKGVVTSDFGPGQVYTTSFDSTGDYPYYCSLHGTKNLNGMSGVIRVVAKK